MITTILIVLVAVVVLIVIIAVLALRFLRADDSDTFDEIPQEPRRTSRPPSEPHRELVPAMAQRERPRRPEPALGQQRQAQRGARPGDDRAQPGYRQRDSQPRPASPDRRPDQSISKRPVPIGARAGQPGRQSDPDGQSTNWDSLSDVDYWAELSSDKPLPTPTPVPAEASAGRRQDKKADARQHPDGRAAGLGEGVKLPVRQRREARAGTAAQADRLAGLGQTQQIDARGQHAPGRYVAEAATESIAALARLGGQQPATGQRPASGQRPGSGQWPMPPAQWQSSGQRPARPAMPQGAGRPPVPLDDDPLTSPSFPAVGTSDSRSYRTQRRGRSAAPGNGPGSGGFTEPTQQFTQYPPVPDRGISGPNGYPVQPPAASVPPAPAQPPGLAANPYGSYVSTPQPTYQEAGSGPMDAGSYGGYSAGQQAANGNNWYGTSSVNALSGPSQVTPALGHATDGYLPSSGMGGNGYSPADYNGTGYQSAAYQNGQAAAASYLSQGHRAAQYEQRGYGSHDQLASGQDGYQAYPGYGGNGR